MDPGEEALLLEPKVSLQGQPKLGKKSVVFDYVFGPEDSNGDVFQALGVPLIARAKEGMVGVVFAYGQTGSGKTHTMNGLMDGMIPLLFGEGRTVRFSYFEALGVTISDCLVARQEPKGVQIGEGLDGPPQWPSQPLSRCRTCAGRCLRTTGTGISQCVVTAWLQVG